ncbi:MAG: GNAT family N-acetyltransferase [Lachnospiraceae bacterium]|nr:GNAT family N-acetyltransferase [Lachnospiraceae bacterium]
MDITYKTTKDNVNWEEVRDVLQRVGMTDLSVEEQRLVFERSSNVVFAYDKDKIIGVSRALSDGFYQAVIYNVALDKEYRGHGIGRELIMRLVDQLKGQNIILYTHPRNVSMYEKFGFRRAKTAMVIFDKSEHDRQWREASGFLMPEGYRFIDEYDREDMKRGRTLLETSGKKK